MKGILLNILTILIVVGLALPTVGRTMATWSDSETSGGNYIETGSIDLKVGGQDDGPWGSGVSPFFEIPEGEVSIPYAHTVSLWNAGDVDGVAYLQIKNLIDPNGLAQNTSVEIWYDGSLVEGGWMSDLAGHEIKLGDLPACTPRDLTMVLHATEGNKDDHLEFDIQFELVGSWADSELNLNYFHLDCELGGTPGFWRSPGTLSPEALEEYDKSDIVSWFRTIVGGSAWYTDVIVTGDLDEDYMTMCGILDDTGADNYIGMVNQFRLQYLATRLNHLLGRLGWTTEHDISGIIIGVTNTETYFGYDIGTLGEIITTIESKASGGIFAEPPSRDEMEAMKTVCDKLNKVDI